VGDVGQECSRIEDGGGLTSSADWLRPQEAADVLGPLRDLFLSRIDEWGLESRLQAGLKKSDGGLLSTDQTNVLRADLLGWLSSKGFQKNGDVPMGQPFALNLLEGLLEVCEDVDKGLPAILLEGVASGLDGDIIPSGVFPLEDREARLRPSVPDVWCCDSNWSSAEDNAREVQSLLVTEEAEGWVEQYPGSLQDAEARWPGRVAVGKLALITADGKDSRLVGDSRSCGASPAARFPERVKNPTPGGLAEGLRRANNVQGSESDPWVALTIDVKAAHKRIRPREKDGGLSFFYFLGTLWRFVVCHFGAAWSAYWYARVGAALHRLLHRILWEEHLAWVYVDDTLVLVRRSRAGKSACLILMLFVCLGVPLSWHKIQFGPEVTYLGLLVNAARCSLGLTCDRVQKLISLLCSLRSRDRLDRRSLQSLTGCLQWASAVLPRLRPWLAEFYRCINSPAYVQQRRVRASTGLLTAAQLWAGALREGPLLLFCRPRVPWHYVSAADAWAAGDHAGIGGWWSSRDDDPWHAVHWFSLQFSTEDVRRWAPLRGDLQKEIAWLELIAQVALLMLKCRSEVGPAPGSRSVQWCDNAATVGACECVCIPYFL
jgi:hypothetical protein